MLWFVVSSCLYWAVLWTSNMQVFGVFLLCFGQVFLVFWSCQSGISCVCVVFWTSYMQVFVLFVLSLNLSYSGFCCVYVMFWTSHRKLFVVVWSCYSQVFLVFLLCFEAVTVWWCCRQRQVLPPCLTYSLPGKLLLSESAKPQNENDNRSDLSESWGLRGLSSITKTQNVWCHCFASCLLEV